MYLDYDLTLRIQKKEKHKVVIDGKEHTANIRVYKFKKLDKDTKLEILKTIKENFKKEYLKGQLFFSNELKKEELRKNVF